MWVVTAVWVVRCCRVDWQDEHAAEHMYGGMDYYDDDFFGVRHEPWGGAGGGAGGRSWWGGLRTGLSPTSSSVLAGVSVSTDLHPNPRYLCCHKVRVIATCIPPPDVLLEGVECCGHGVGWRGVTAFVAYCAPVAVWWVQAGSHGGEWHTDDIFYEGATRKLMEKVGSVLGSVAPVWPTLMLVDVQGVCIAPSALVQLSPSSRSVSQGGQPHRILCTLVTPAAACSRSSARCLKLPTRPPSGLPLPPWNHLWAATLVPNQHPLGCRCWGWCSPATCGWA